MLGKSLFKAKSLIDFRALKTSKKQPGQVPGTAVHTGIRHLESISIIVHDIGKDEYNRTEIDDIGELNEVKTSGNIRWVQVSGLHDTTVLQQIWNAFDVHPLIREDVVNVAQRPRIEHYQDSIFFVLRMMHIQNTDGASLNLQPEQISIILKQNLVLTFQETNKPVFTPVITRLQNTGTRIRTLGADYLAYALSDTITDHYFLALDVISETLEKLEEVIIEDARPFHLQQIHALRRDLIYFRKSVWSLRDGLNTLIRDDHPFIKSETKLFYRDVHDHIVNIIDSIESNKEMVYSLYDMYMSYLSHRMNEVMKVLTIIATLFIPLTFIVGVYGMNFNPDASPWNMPELDWYYGYPMVMGGMFAVAVGMLIYFRRKGWF